MRSGIARSHIVLAEPSPPALIKMARIPAADRPGRSRSVVTGLGAVEGVTEDEMKAATEAMRVA